MSLRGSRSHAWSAGPDPWRQDFIPGDSAAQQPAGAVERVVLVAAMAGLLLLYPAAYSSKRLEAEPDDVEGVQDVRGVGQVGAQRG